MGLLKWLRLKDAVERSNAKGPSLNAETGTSESLPCCFYITVELWASEHDLQFETVGNCVGQETIYYWSNKADRHSILFLGLIYMFLLFRQKQREKETREAPVLWNLCSYVQRILLMAEQSQNCLLEDTDDITDAERGKFSSPSAPSPSCSRGSERRGVP